MKKILQLSTYPIKKPLHGGQIRVSQIKFFFQNKGCKVKSLSLSETSHGYYGENDYLLKNDELFAVSDVPFVTDYATSQICSKGKAFEFLKKNIIAFDPDIVFLEQVWLWPAVKRAISEKYLKKNCKIIYSSQNIEYKTKDSLLKSHNIQSKNIISKIYELEKELVKASDAVIACTKHDSQEFKKMGAKETVVCNNGVIKHKEDIAVSNQLLSSLNNRKYILFVGSAYPPNALGFWEMIGNSLAWLSPEYIIIVAGGVSNILQEYQHSESELYKYVNFDRIKKVGFVSEKLLSSLLKNALVIVLPITIGGGSNLKTAEAIASLSPVVATSKACRGFEFADKLSHFAIEDDANKFIEAIKIFLDQNEKINIDAEEQDLRTSVLWENTLKPLEKFIL